MTVATDQTTIRSTDQRDANLALVSRALGLLMTEATSEQLVEVYTPGFRYHEPRVELAGVPGARRICEKYLAGFSDVEMDVSSMDETGDRVTTHVTLRGRHTGCFDGHRPTGRLMEARGIFVHRVESGRIAEAWAMLRWN